MALQCKCAATRWCLNKDNRAATWAAPRPVDTEPLTRPGFTRSHLKPPLSTRRSYCLTEDAAGRDRDTPSAHALLPAAPLTPTAAHLLLGRFPVTGRHRYLRGGGEGRKEGMGRRLPGAGPCAHAPTGEFAQYWRWSCLPVPPSARPARRRAGACAVLLSGALVLSRCQRTGR